MRNSLKTKRALKTLDLHINKDFHEHWGSLPAHDLIKLIMWVLSEITLDEWKQYSSDVIWASSQENLSSGFATR